MTTKCSQEHLHVTEVPSGGMNKHSASQPMVSFHRRIALLSRLAVFWLLSLGQILAAQDGLYCFYLADGSSVPLHWLSDRMVVETTTEMAAKDRDAFAARLFGGVGPATIRPIAANGRSFALDLPTSLSAKAWTVQAATLSADKMVRRVYPMFRDQPGGHRAILTDEILVCLTENVSVERLSGLASPFRLQLLGRDRHDQRIVRLRIENPQAFTALELSNALFHSRAVLWAEPNFRIELRRAYSPNDPFFPQQWHLRNTGQTGGLPDADTDATEAWDITRGLSRVIIAILDDGLDLDHPDLRDNIFVNSPEIAGNGRDDDANGYVDDVNGWDFYANDNNPRPDGPEDYHSTPCSGLAAAVADNRIGVAGVAPRCTILPCRVMGKFDITISQVAEAIHYASLMADVLSLSWTSLANNTIAASLQNAATDGRRGQGCLICAATGNDYRTDGIGFPASLSFVMAIGASTFRDVRAAYSNYAPGYGVFLLAPSSEPALANGVLTLQPGGGYGPFWGTSAGPPQVSAICGLILSIAPNLSRTEIQTVLRQTADRIDPAAAAYDASGYSNSYGYGRVNANRAVIEVAPDLSPSAFDFQPEVVARGGTLAFSGGIRNWGRGASGPCWLEFWLSSSPSFASLDAMACISVHLPVLASGAEFRLESIAANLAPNVADGFYRLGIVIDRLNEQIELNETNNSLYPTNRTLQVGAGSTNVDLTIEGFDFSPVEAISGDRITFKGRIANRGTQMSRRVWVEFWLSAKTTGGSLERVLCKSAETGWLGPGEAFDLSLLSRTVYGPAQGMRNGRYRVGVVVDRGGEQVETNKSNNTRFRLDKWLAVGAATNAGAWHWYR